MKKVRTPVKHTVDERESKLQIRDIIILTSKNKRGGDSAFQGCNYTFKYYGSVFQLARILNKESAERKATPCDLIYSWD